MSNTQCFITDGKLNGLGNINAKHIFYLPSAPQIPNDKICAAEIIALNGNHWRKILTILAKLICPSQDWKTFRDNDLLNHVFLSFEHNLSHKTYDLHCICGKSHWQALAIDPGSQGFKEFVAEGEMWTGQYAGQQMILTPYPDYRQFNNALIALTKANYFD